MTISATGDRRAFTIVEILLALALVLLIGTIFISGTNSLLAGKTATPDEQFWTACAQARREALEEQRSVVMTYDPKTRGFILNDGAQTRSVPVNGPEDLVIDFHPAQSDATSATSLIGGVLVEMTPLAAVTFYSDGTCTPFRVQLRTSAGAHLLSIDPWTCAPILNPTDGRA
jgi:Tfp pilus assembly protein FimT